MISSVHLWACKSGLHLNFLIIHFFVGIKQHHFPSPTISPVPISVDVLSNIGAPKPKIIDLSECGTKKGCYRSPPGCEEDRCRHVVTWRAVQEVESRAARSVSAKGKRARDVLSGFAAIGLILFYPQLFTRRLENVVSL